MGSVSCSSRLRMRGAHPRVLTDVSLPFHCCEMMEGYEPAQPCVKKVNEWFESPRFKPLVFEQGWKNSQAEAQVVVTGPSCVSAFTAH